MRGTTMRAASICTALLGLSALTVACGDPDPVTPDSGPGPRDSGQDSGGDLDAGPVDGGEGVDAGTDGGPPPRANLRLAHLIPGAPDVHICLAIPAGSATWTLITRDASNAPTAIPYGGVSSYVNRLPLPAPVTIQVRVFPEDAITGPSMDVCPTTGDEAIIDQTIAGGDFVADGFYTIAATGLTTATAGTEQVPELVIFEDEITAPTTAGDTRLRLVNAVPNMPLTAGTGIDLCIDTDPTDTTDPVELFDDVSFEEAADYLERAPIVGATPPTVLSLHAHVTGAGDCATATRLAQIPIPIPLPAGVPANYTDEFAADTSNTLFFVGNGMIVNPLPCTMASDCTTAGPTGTTCGPAGRCTHPLAPTVIPVNDTFVPAP